MTKVFKDIKLGLDEDIKEKLQLLSPNFSDFRILKKSVDARQRHNPHFVYSVEVAGPGETLPQIEFHLDKLNQKIASKPIVIGSGPAGLFAALRLVERGIPCLLFERGSVAEKRIMGINKFWRYGELDPRNNVCFGEGGAGLYSDGKLITRIKSPHIPYVMNRLVQFGAPAEIEFLSNPHVGSDKIRRVIPKMRQFLLQNGCEFFPDTRIVDFVSNGSAITGVVTERNETYLSDHIILATGHSAEDVFHSLEKHGVQMEAKSYALGLRIEHPQAAINKIQYRDYFAHPKLGSANYKLTYHDHDTNTGVYSFCMCPGGFVLSSGTEADGVVCNGMSNFNRNSPYANSAIVVTIDAGKDTSADLWGGMKLRRDIETKAFKAVQARGGTKQLPAQKLTDFLKGKAGDTIPGSSPSGTVGVNLQSLLPKKVNQFLLKGLENFDTKMKGFVIDKAQFYGVETRTSCPIRVTRHEDTLQSVSHKNLYPTGEGAGYAGGITSAACDGIDVAEKIYELLKPN
jgi:uncharacterized protein